MIIVFVRLFGSLLACLLVCLFAFLRYLWIEITSTCFEVKCSVCLLLRFYSLTLASKLHIHLFIQSSCLRPLSIVCLSIDAILQVRSKISPFCSTLKTLNGLNVMPPLMISFVYLPFFSFSFSFFFFSFFLSKQAFSSLSLTHSLVFIRIASQRRLLQNCIQYLWLEETEKMRLWGRRSVVGFKICQRMARLAREILTDKTHLCLQLHSKHRPLFSLGFENLKQKARVSPVKLRMRNQCKLTNSYAKITLLSNESNSSEQ